MSCGGVHLASCLMRCMAVLASAWNSFSCEMLSAPRLLSCKLENVWQHSGGRLSGSGYVSRAVTFKVKDLGCHLGM